MSKTPKVIVSTYYEIKEGKLIRKRKFCPRCGPGVFLAEHKDRFSCGKCGYTEYKKKEQSSK
jgi:small subunit ribosomal protein S27Ae